MIDRAVAQVFRYAVVGFCTLALALWMAGTIIEGVLS